MTTTTLTTSPSSYPTGKSALVHSSVASLDSSALTSIASEIVSYVVEWDKTLYSSMSITKTSTSTKTTSAATKTTSWDPQCATSGSKATTEQAQDAVDQFCSSIAGTDPTDTYKSYAEGSVTAEFGLTKKEMRVMFTTLKLQKRNVCLSLIIFLQLVLLVVKQ